MTQTESSPATIGWVREGGLLAAFFALVWLSGEQPLSPRVPPSYIAILFVPVALLFLAALLRPWRLFPVYAATFVAALVGFSAYNDFSLLAGLAYGIVDVVEVVAVMLVWRHLPRLFPHASESVRGSLRMLGMTLACALVAIPATGAVAIFGRSRLINFTDVVDVWLNWLMGDILAYVVVGLPVYILVNLLRRGGMTRRELLLLAGYGLLMLAFTVILFSPSAVSYGEAFRPLALYLPFPVLLFGAVRFTHPGAALGAMLMAIPAIQLTATGHGPFAWPAVGANVLHFQAYIWIASLSSTLVADLAWSLRRQRDRVIEQNTSLREANRVALAASRARTDFLASLSHELRTPLNAIRGFSEMIEREVMGPIGQPRYVGYARDIGAAGLAMQSMVEELLRIAALDAGRAELESTHEPLNQLIHAATRAVSPDPGSHRLRLRLDTPAQLVVPGPPETIGQILTNLLANAMQYSPTESPVTVRAKLVGERAVVEVRDRGPGMVLAFDSNGMPIVETTGDAWVAERKGLGLGLRLCKVLCDRIGADLEFVSREGGGTTARVIFPAP
ncbi:MAG: ATP-binding protein [Pseudomonadota bacterium]|nr:ATP-binding protein [Pseudomonadota bacterium]